MRLILLGAPGAGKGTQAVFLAGRLNVPHVSTGDIFRENIRNGTELGKKAKEFINKGELVPDEVTVGIVKERLSQHDCKNGFILDGFPRTLYQAQYLERVLKDMGVEMDYVIDIHVPDDEIIRRMSGRRVCPACGATYHIRYNPPVAEGLCDKCKQQLAQRKDDEEKTVIARLKTYHHQTEPLIDYYKKQGKLLTVIGAELIEETSERVLKALGVVK